jgi:hypothetical protein
MNVPGPDLELLPSALHALAQEEQDLDAVRESLAEWRAGDPGVPLEDAFDAIHTDEPSLLAPGGPAVALAYITLIEALDPDPSNPVMSLATSQRPLFLGFNFTM